MKIDLNEGELEALEWVLGLTIADENWVMEQIHKKPDIEPTVLSMITRIVFLRGIIRKVIKALEEQE